MAFLSGNGFLAPKADWKVILLEGTATSPGVDSLSIHRHQVRKQPRRTAIPYYNDEGTNMHDVIFPNQRRWDIAESVQNTKRDTLEGNHSRVEKVIGRNVEAVKACRGW